MNENQANDVEILKIKKSKRASSLKKKSLKSQKEIANNNKTENNNELNSKNQIHSNINQLKVSDINLFASSTFEPLKSSLEVTKEMIIQQESDILEAVTGCQEPNNYQLFGKLPNNEKFLIFKCREYSSCGMRCCCPVNCRGLVMKIKLALSEDENNDNDNDNGNDGNKDDEYNNSILFVEKNFKCPFFNCVRPEMKIFLTETNTLLGTIENAFSCCDPVFNIYDKEGKLIFYIESDCCQCGYICRNNCIGKTEECVFFIYRENDKSNAIGEINKKAASSLLSIADNYSIIFPKNATIEEKVLLMISAVMIDYQYFEKNAPGL